MNSANVQSKMLNIHNLSIFCIRGTDRVTSLRFAMSQHFTRS